MAQIENLDKLISKLGKISKMDLQQALNKACLIVENEAKMRCPVDDGQLRQSITHEVDNNEGYVGTNVEYAPYVEIGTGLFSSKGTGRKDVPWVYQDAEGKWWTTVGQKPQPFLQPALDNNRNEIIKLFQEEIQKEVSRNAQL